MISLSKIQKKKVNLAKGVSKWGEGGGGRPKRAVNNGQEEGGVSKMGGLGRRSPRLISSPKTVKKLATS